MTRSNKSPSRTGRHSKRQPKKLLAPARKSADTSMTLDRKASSTASSKNKTEAIIALLRRPKGAALAELCKATGWQAHSVRGAISGTLKTKLGLKVVSAKIDGVRTYGIAR